MLRDGSLKRLTIRGDYVIGPNGEGIGNRENVHPFGLVEEGTIWRINSSSPMDVVTGLDTNLENDMEGRIVDLQVVQSSLNQIGMLNKKNSISKYSMDSTQFTSFQCNRDGIVLEDEQFGI